MEALWSHYGAEVLFAGVEMERPQPLWGHYGVTMGAGGRDVRGPRATGDIWGARGGASHYGGTMESLWSRAARRSHAVERPHPVWSHCGVTMWIGVVGHGKCLGRQGRGEPLWRHYGVTMEPRRTPQS